MANPTKFLRRRLGAAIDWRVRDAVSASLPAAVESLTPPIDAPMNEATRNALAAIGASLADVSTSLSDQQQALGRLVEDLDRRMRALEDTE